MKGEVYYHLSLNERLIQYNLKQFQFLICYWGYCYCYSQLSTFAGVDNRDPHRYGKSANFLCPPEKHIRIPNFKLIWISCQSLENTICGFILLLMDEKASPLIIIWNQILQGALALESSPHWIPPAMVKWACFTLYFITWTKHY